MRTFTRFVKRALPALIFLSIIASCNKFPSDSGQGTLRWSFSPGVVTRSVLELPDTDSFRLKVVNSANVVLYEGRYGDSPESMLVNPGTYTVSVASRVFEVPEFEAPQFGDEQVVVVKAGAVTNALLECSQLNSGLRLRLASDFGDVYPGGHLEVSSPEGSLTYAPSETRTGFFKPGNVSIFIKDGTSSTPLLTRNLSPREILTIGITCPSGAGPGVAQGGSLSISVDTLRTWTEEEFEIGSQGEGDAGTSPERAYGVAQVKDHVGEKGVWVRGYIVGGDLSSGQNGIKFEGPFESLTNIAIASRSSVSEKSSCVSVQLAKGAIRDALNLVQNSGHLGRMVYLKGDIEAAYFGLPGIKNLTEYSFQ